MEVPIALSCKECIAGSGKGVAIFLLCGSKMSTILYSPPFDDCLVITVECSAFILWQLLYMRFIGVRIGLLMCSFLKAHVLEGSVQECGIANLTGASARGSAAVIINATLNIDCGKHNLTIPAMEHL